MDAGAERGMWARAGQGALSGAIGAMAMTGARRLTTLLGLVQKVPPEEIVRHQGLRWRRRIPTRSRRSLTELAHWAYGALGGAAFGALPRDVQRRRVSGPLFGLFVWLGFEAGVAPLLRLRRYRSPPPKERAALLADHLLYGLIVGRGARRLGRAPGAEGGTP